MTIILLLVAIIVIVITTFEVRGEEKYAKLHLLTCLQIQFLHKVTPKTIRTQLIQGHLAVLYEHLCDARFAHICATLLVFATYTATYAAYTQCNEDCQIIKACSSRMSCTVCTSACSIHVVKNQSKLLSAVHWKSITQCRLLVLIAISLSMTHRSLAQHIMYQNRRC